MSFTHNVHNGTSQPSLRLSEVRSTLRDLQAENILRVLPGLYVGGFLLIAGAGKLQNPSPAGISAVILFLLPIVIWVLRQPNYLTAAWGLVLGFLVVDLLIVVWGGIHAAICLLTLPVGLATLFVSVGGGALTATACSLWLYASATSIPDPGLRVTALVGVWSVVGLIWLTRHPFSMAMEWYHFSYERNRYLLEQARDSRVHLKQTLKDLEEANLQLTRLNNLAQGLRHVAEEARRMKEQFVANVSHELRTPLNMIVGFSEMIMRSPDIYDGDLPPGLLADLDVIHRNSQHLSRLIDDVLDLSQVEAEQVALTKERVTFQEVVSAAVVAVRPLFDSKGLSLEAEIPDDLPKVLCDPTRIRQVVLNLLSNAGRFTARGGVHIRAWREKNDLLVSVADTGPGIPAEDMDKLFQPFQQVDGSIRRRYGGTGLGLCISKRFIELHGGKIWVESEEGVGTTFFFRIPVAPSTLVSSGGFLHSLNPSWEYLQRTRPSAAPKPVARPRFLVLETGYALRRLLSRYMNGVEIASVSSLQEAIQELSDVPARALLVNDMSVGEALRHLEETGGLPYGTPAITCSVPGVHEAAGGLGVSDYLVKPISRDKLLTALDRLRPEGKTVLIVDDEPEALRLFRRMLVSSGRGYRILKATDGQQGMRILREQGADVILLDLIMPRMNGFRFLADKSQDQELRDIPVIVISARDPTGQPIVSSALAVTRGGGLSVPQLLACIDSLSRVLSTADQGDGPVLTEAPSDRPAYG